MSMKRKFGKFAVVFLSVVLLAGAFTMNAAQAEVKTLRLGHVVQEGSAPDAGSRMFAELVKTKSGGTMLIEVYASGTLGQNREMVEMLQSGALDFTHPTVAVLSGFTNKTKVLDLPFLFKDAASAEKVLTGTIGQEILSSLEEKGLIGLGWYSQGWRNTTTNKEIHNPEDFKGIKIRTQDNALHLAAFNQLGASAIPMAFSEVFTGLQQKTIDAQENPYTNIFLNGYYEVQKYVIETQHIYDCIALLMSEKVFNSLTAEQQTIIRESALEAAAFEREFVMKKDAESKQAIIDTKKTEIIELTSEQRAAFREAVQPVYDKYAAEIGEDLIKQIADLQK